MKIEKQLATQSISERLAAFAYGATYDGIPADVMQRA